MGKKGIDKTFLVIICLLVTFGFLVFISASMSYATSDNINIARAILMQSAGLIIGLVGAFIVAFYSNTLPLLKKIAPWLFGAALILTALVFTKLGVSLNGGRRWLDVFGFSFQPAEFLKPATLIFLAYFYSEKKDRIGEFMYGLLPLLAILGVTVGMLALQPDMDGALTIVILSVAIYFSAGGKWRDIIILIVLGVVASVAVVMWKPYVMDRINVFKNPDKDLQGTGWQVNQSLIAVGSGQLTGRGFGQSLQKFRYLPESSSDAIFSVASEEFGFAGSSAIIILFTLFLLRGLRIATKTFDNFGGLITVGIVILIITQSFLNIGSMIAIMPLSGLPLAFFSKGGTVIVFNLIEVGLIMNVSRYIKTSKK